MIYCRDRHGRGGGHIPFVECGFTAIRITESDEDYTHQHENIRKEGDIQYGDLTEFADFGYVASD
jgi:hypothetical protein